MGLGSSGASGAGTSYSREGTVPKYTSSGALPAQANEGDLAIVTDSDPNAIYSYEESGSTWKQVGTSGSGANWSVEHRTITSGEITNKELTLANSPSGATSIIVDIVGGTAQGYTSDYVVSGSTLSWNGKNLDGVLEENDVVRVSYTY